MPKLLPIAVLLFSTVLSASPCDLNVRGVPAEAPLSIEWDRYVGALTYRITESRDDFNTTRAYLSDKTTFKIPHRVSEATKYSYRVDALFDPAVQIDGACIGMTELTLQPDPQFRRMTRKSIVPVVGSVVGATGAKFRTSLRMTSNAAGQRGKIVFHPAGQARDVDPSIRYAFNGLRQTLSWDDIVESIGSTGIGSLDIVPDDDGEPTPPLVLARHYTDATMGTFGAFEPAVVPFDFLTPPGFTVTVPDARFRVNLGFRTLTATTVQALVYNATGSLRALKTTQFPADYFALIPAAQLVGETVAGETFTLSFDGSVVPFYTITENGTNDPAVVIPRATASRFIQ